jgi:hypothetical protein
MVLYDRNDDKVISVEAPDMHVETLTDDVPEPENEDLGEYAPDDDFFLD